VYQAYDQGNVWSGMIIYTPDKAPGVVEASEEFRKTAPENSALGVGVGCAPGTDVPTVLISLFYNGPEAEGRKVFKSFFDIGTAMEMVETRPYVKQVSTPPLHN
jgi:hypothetical protein